MFLDHAQSDPPTEGIKVSAAQAGAAAASAEAAKPVDPLSLQQQVDGQRVIVMKVMPSDVGYAPGALASHGL